MGKSMYNGGTGKNRYLASIAHELDTQSTRVRDLIGHQHWLSDGHHKEYLLAALLKRHLPSGMIVSRGFVVSPYENACSTEQDILVIDDTKEAPLFYQGELAICFPRTVIAAISVKSTLKGDTMLDVVKGLNSVRDVARDDVSPRSIWCGGFFYEKNAAVGNDIEKVYDYVLESLRQAPAKPPSLAPEHPYPIGPDAFCTAKDILIKIDFGSGVEADESSAAHIIGYRCDGLAAALFIASLLEHVASVRGLHDANFCDFADESGTSIIGTGRIFE